MRSRPTGRYPWLFAAAAFLSAWLLFMVQPLFAKMLLPLLGGTPAVWNTCLVSFQLLLLAGYAYAHVTTARLGIRRQAALHLAMLILPLCALPIQLPPGWIPPATTSPIPWLLLVLAVTVGLPFFVISASAPLLQQWFAQASGGSDAQDPYFLYAASNLGSFLALLGYPIAIEPRLRLADQSLAWAVGYTALILLMAACAWRVLRAAPHRTGTAAAPQPAAPQSAQAPGQRLRWVLLAAVPSSLLLGVTSHISTDLAAVPLLWIIPLALYLLTFVLVFARTRLIPHEVMVWALPFCVLPLAMFMAARLSGPAWMILLHLLGFFIACMVCHGELAAGRPPPERLTAFYLCMALGGVLGGACNALIAPVMFDTIIEYPLAIVLACLMAPSRAPLPRRAIERGLDYAMPVGILLLSLGMAWAMRRIGSAYTIAGDLVMYGVPVIACFTARRRPVRFSLSVAAFILVGLWGAPPNQQVRYTARSFFGVHRITHEQAPDDPYGYSRLTHGTTLHGLQSLDPARACEPLSYFWRGGPLGEAFRTLRLEARRDIAVMGLGTGSIAAYAQPGQRWTYYEIDPVVEYIAVRSGYFTFLRDCVPSARVVLGDARLMIAREPDQAFDVLILDVFSSDAVPMHLLTREAVRLYFTKLRPGGILLTHLSNRYLDLAPVLAVTAAEAGLAYLVRSDTVKPAPGVAAHGSAPSIWAVLARQPADLDGLLHHPGWQPAQARSGKRAWTDDFSNLLSALR